jgi:type IV pilus assembly protein PilV
MQKQTGFTLIEILVTVIVLSIGLLGLAGLQATSLKFNSTAYQRSQATSLAYDIADRMRANVVVARAGNYDIALGAAAPTGTTPAAIDLQEWRRALTNTLPSGTGSIDSVTNSPVFTIIIQWDDDRDATTQAQLFQMDTQL